LKTALLTGITGQDGAYLAKLLLEKNYNVYGAVRDATNPSLINLTFLGITDAVQLISTNLRDLSNVIRLLEKVQPGEIYNLASQSSVGRSFEQPIGTVEFNVLSTINLLEAIRFLALDARFYQASSSEMFGKVSQLPVTEETTLHPVSPYGISKAAAHWITVNYREAYELFSCCGILFNHESVLRAGHFVTKKILSTAVRISKRSREKLQLGNIEIKRDWGYAPEYVKAMWLMLQQENADDFVIATGEPHSVAEFTAKVFNCVGLDWKEHVVTDERFYRPSEINIIYGDPSKARINLRWDYSLSFDDLIGLLVEEERSWDQDILH
jgi:GDPmannose 4,6-dehydratase